ncbi:MAG: hypothetical protein REI78_06980 [Pedobacter sp.]|nr:hypothetical protein [Pedobacter sp.]MDQ8052751.1 hypothetical protein [Pedobacter sp.]
MQTQEIKIGDIVRHRNIMRGTDLSVVSIAGDQLTVRYAHNGQFHTQELTLSEVELFVQDGDEYD